MQLASVDVNKLRSIGDKAVGLAKELAGSIAGNERLEEAGEAQQAKAAETLRALRAEAKASAKDAKAEAMRRRQTAAQRSKQ